MLLHRDNTADIAEAQVSAVWATFIHNYILISQNYVRYYRIKLGRVDIQNIHHLLFLKTIKIKLQYHLKFLNFFIECISPLVNIQIISVPVDVRKDYFYH